MFNTKRCTMTAAFCAVYKYSYLLTRRKTTTCFPSLKQNSAHSSHVVSTRDGPNGITKLITLIAHCRKIGHWPDASGKPNRLSCFSTILASEWHISISTPITYHGAATYWVSPSFSVTSHRKSVEHKMCSADLVLSFPWRGPIYDVLMITYSHPVLLLLRQITAHYTTGPEV